MNDSSIARELPLRKFLVVEKSTLKFLTFLHLICLRSFAGPEPTSGTHESARYEALHDFATVRSLGFLLVY